MRQIIRLLSIVFVVSTLAACNRTTTYSRQLDAEKQLIKEFIERNQLNILTAWPDSDYVWSEKDYVQVPGKDYLYFHQVEAGDVNTDSLTNTDEIIMRVRKYTLTAYADTISYWTTMDGSNPVSFALNNYSTSEWTGLCACEGVAVALKHMKYKNAEAKIICPSKLGIATDGNTVTPYGYDLKIKGIKK